MLNIVAQVATNRNTSLKQEVDELRAWEVGLENPNFFF